VQGFADVVVGEPDERDAVPCGVGKPGCQLDTLRNEESEVVEPCVAPRRACTGLLVEHEQPAAAGAEARPARALLDDLQSHWLAVVVDRAREVGDRQVHGPGPRLRSDPARHGTSVAAGASAGDWRKNAL